MEVKSRFPEHRSPNDHDRLAPPTPSPVTYPQTFGQLLERSAERFGDRTFLPRQHARGGEPVSFRALRDEVRTLAAGLASLGISHGDRVALISENRAAWLAADLAIASLGAVDVPRGVDTAPAELAFILRHSAARLALVENDAVAGELARLRAELPALEGIGSLQEQTEVEGVDSLAALRRRGERWLADHRGELEARASAVSGDDLLTIVYTSGTTAEPKGVMLTHGNVLSNVRTVNMVLDLGASDRFLSALPPWHMYERMMDYVALAVGAELVYTDRRRIKEDLGAMRPTLFAAVPRIWETIYDGIVGHTNKLPPAKRKMMLGVLQLCQRVGGRRANWRDRATHRLLRATLLPKFQRITGGRLRLAVSGGGALPSHVDETLLGLGIPICNGYGLTETSPVISVRTPETNRGGTIGHPLPETRVEIRGADGAALPPGDSGVIWVRGPCVMRGYYQNPERTADALRDGWFNTGDLGHIEPDGQLCITGRAKDTIVLASGENVEPEPVEGAIVKSRWIQQAVVVGQDRKSLGALLVLADAAEEAVPRSEWQVEGDLVQAARLHQLLRPELDRLLDRANGFRPSERVSAFAILHQPMSPENGLATQTLKIKRHVVAERFADVIAALFERS